MPPPAPAPDPDLRPHLLRALEADLVGPFLLDHAAPEALPLSPSRWYLTGFLAPEGSADLDDALEEDDAGAGDDEDDGEQSPQEAQPKAPKRLPSSIGLSVLLHPGAGDVVTVRLSFAEYTLDAVAPARAEMRHGEAIKPTSASARQRWTRRPAAPVELDMPLDPAALRAGRQIAPGLWIEGHLAPTAAHGIDARALSLFVVNRRDPGPVEPARADEQFVFQVELSVRHAEGLVPRPNRRDEGSQEQDEEVADLQFRTRFEYAVGHNVAAEPIAAEGRVTGARTTWIPTAVVPRVLTRELGDEVTTGMAALADLGDGEAVRGALGELVTRYSEWIEQQRGSGSTRRRAARRATCSSSARRRPEDASPRASRCWRRSPRRSRRSASPTAPWPWRPGSAARRGTPRGRRRRRGGSSSSPSCCSTWRASPTRRTPTARTSS